ncbi:MAG: enoyl-CoA hydratase-related protein, partial [Sphingomonas sp.]
AFCAGADLAAAATDYAGSDDRGLGLEIGFNPLAEALAALPVPLVVAVNGAAAGAGCSYALAGDIVLAARSAYFVQSFAQIGLAPDAGATWLLPRLAGSARARAMMLLGDRISATQAEAWGMIHAAVDDGELMPAARAMAARLAAGPTLAYGLIRQGLARATTQTFAETLAMEREHQRIAGRTADHAEGIAAFRARRAPRFTGG